MLYQWILPELVDDQNIPNIFDNYKLHPSISKILNRRNISTSEKLSKYFNTSLKNLYDPFLLTGMDRAVERIIKALRDGENILIYGDYDVDGVTSVSILYDSLFRMGGKVSFFIPDRFVEGYGLSVKGIKKAKTKRASLIITVDCGITAFEEINYAGELGIDVIVCDHHEPGEKLPDAVALINPKLLQSVYPFKELAGCGVAFKLLQALAQELGLTVDYPYKYLDLVALGTAADIVDLLDENRILVKNGLDIINSNPRPGLFALMETCGLLGRELTVNLIVFILAPRLNAVGRISNAKKAVHLLTTKSVQQGKNISKILEKENLARRTIDESTFEEAQRLVDESVDLDSSRVLVLSKENWHTGVIGIVSSRIMEKHNRPAVLISIQDGVGKGSARSTTNFDIYNAFKKLNHLLLNFGGHRFAAGLTIKSENIPSFTEAINQLAYQEIEEQDILPKLNIDAELRLNQLDAAFFSGLKVLAPFGPKNMRPVFVSFNLKTYGAISVVGNNHLKLKCKQDDVVLDAIGYNLGDYVDELKKPHKYMNCAYVIEENYWSGRTTIQMRIKDFEVI